MSRTPDSGPAAPQAGQPGSRPSLFAGTPPVHDDGPVSILSAMDDTPAAVRPQLSQRQLWPWLGGGLLAAAGLIWIANNQKSETERPSPRQTLVSASSPAPVMAAASTVPVVDAAASSSPAVIEVTVAASPSPTALPSSASSNIAVEPPAVSDATLLIATGAGAAAATALVAAPEAVASAPKKPSKRAEAKAKVKAKPKAERGFTAAERSERSTAPKPVATSSATSSADADVDLIAAVMRHGDAPAAGRNASGETAAPSSIASLVSRCKSLGGDEAKACRQRLCEGYWGKAEACPKRLAPKGSTQASTETKPKRKKKKTRPASSASKA